MSSLALTFDWYYICTLYYTPDNRYLLSTYKYQIAYNRLNNESAIAHSNSDWI